MLGQGVGMIEVLSIRSELDRLDALNRESFCAEHQDVPEARCSRWRLAFEKAAAKGDRNALVCANCATRWMPDIDINYAVRGWMMLVGEGRWSCSAAGGKTRTAVRILVERACGRPGVGCLARLLLFPDLSRRTLL
jgi:hypothetical protein